ncbi:MAG: DUF2202 domain-containing protein [Gudongella sp.]|nr:DUF2202 domain-containing protein [Gudongella sp.]
MKIIKYTLNLNRKFTTFLVVLAIAVSSMFMLVGCSTGDEDTAIDTTLSAQDINSESPVITPPVDHNVDINPDPLADSDKALSLEGYGAIGALTDENLTINDMLTYAVQDEYLARGEYLAIIDKFGDQKPYSNIVQAEETHLAYLEEIYLSYEIDFPDDTSAGHIIVPADLLEAAETGVQAEIDNIEMYELFLSYDLPDNVFEVFSALKSGSDSHLLAFQKQVNKLK